MFSDAAARTAPFGGDLLSVICHRGGASGYGHFISYHKVTGQWYRNDDSKRCRPCNNPLLQQIPGETADVLFFKTDF